MDFNFTGIILGALAASVGWFFAGSILYMNPIIRKLYKKAEGSPGVKIWKSTPKYLFIMYLGLLAQCLLFVFVFLIVRPQLPADPVFEGIAFGFVLLFVKNFPKFFDTWIQTTYPKKLLAVELINGTISGVIIGLAFAYII